ncbi:hypothetical protein QQ008_24650 [Fulvivirgaceae bacterium BMA10]|uniref:Uncharacterized protein n=1 Tax=Splendidivirga corallicola TaxID=3051826 RepID=A0ABT8KV06_9BACT|nr:hypothetical protein [Fulvivirgaceae bacterium BMA10]
MGYKQKPDTPPMERELNYLLADLCIKWGFCIPSDSRRDISKAEYYHARDFAKDVVEAEGMNPEHETRWVRKISDKFKERFGGIEINSSTFIDRIRDFNENW